MVENVSQPLTLRKTNMYNRQPIEIRHLKELFQQMSVALENFTQDFVELIRYTQSKIESEEEVLERAKIMDELMDMANSEDDIVMLFANAISDRIEEFENQQLEWHRMKPNEVLANLMQIHQIEPKDLFNIAPQLKIAELLNEKQAMTLEHVKGFSKFFKVPVALFID